MNSEKKRIIDKAKFARFHYNDYVAATEKKLESSNRTRINHDLYRNGFSWFMDGNKLDDAVTEINYFGKTIMLKDIVSFQRGYQQGLIQVGTNYGYNGTNLDDIDVLYKDDKYFLTGYKKGIEMRQIEEKKKTR